MQDCYRWKDTIIDIKQIISILARNSLRTDEKLQLNWEKLIKPHEVSTDSREVKRVSGAGYTASKIFVS